MSRKREKGVPLALTLGTKLEGTVGEKGRPNPTKRTFPRPSPTARCVLEPAWFPQAILHVPFLPPGEKGLLFLPPRHRRGPPLGSKSFIQVESEDTPQ